MLTRRTLLPLLLLPVHAHAQARSAESMLLLGAQLRIGVERLAKLELERALLPQRADPELGKERPRLQDILSQMADPRQRPSGLSGRRLAQLDRALEDAQLFIERRAPAAAIVLSESEALAARLGFVTTALSATLADAERGALVDLLARASASALRVGKLNFAAAGLRRPAADVAVGAQQSLLEFQSALQALNPDGLPDKARQELELARHQWLIFRAGLQDNGLLKPSARLTDLASTTDRIAESLGRMARRLLV